MGGLMRLVVIDSLERFHGAMRDKEAHAVEEAPWARNIGHAQQRFPYDTRCPLLKPSFFNHCPAPRRHAWRHQWLPHPPPSSHLAHANPIFITTRQRQARHICITPMMIPHARQHTRSTRPSHPKFENVAVFTLMTRQDTPLITCQESRKGEDFFEFIFKNF